ncbi:type II toxin-antitoxin system RnlB family antitoxin [Endozoicomonas gorgoniicola]|uniref:Type II toxin-antitoxin system RnlB family antitoxin n=1 Tax=Endozoicomonas gorgoniicola TaxID=1234144 RepID=A0ABT3MWJ6_9GAMM|nr:type II toxin-antitoxin system RnlB family antitoxin [Endozoicomonas gorgoniicola]MCW7553741.1 type II toxin-antitoxin system RnlB family antitoxin [Endozoicomonas gorgoniicola]
MIQVRKVDNSQVAVVTALVDYHPMQHLKDLSSKLKSFNYSGSVVFDLLVFNGLASNRFVAIIFNGNNFDRKTFKVLTDIDQDLKQGQDKYFRAHPDLLKASVLSSSELKNF